MFGFNHAIFQRSYRKKKKYHEGEKLDNYTNNQKGH